MPVILKLNGLLIRHFTSRGNAYVRMDPNGLLKTLHSFKQDRRDNSIKKCHGLKVNN